MPIYEFRCRECGRKYEILCRVGEDGAGLTCPACGQVGAKRCQSAFSARAAGANGAASSLGGSGCGST